MIIEKLKDIVTARHHDRGKNMSAMEKIDKIEQINQTSNTSLNTIRRSSMMNFKDSQTNSPKKAVKPSIELQKRLKREKAIINQ
jgi:hypothetical protein